ncbi:MAG TPA: M36 family metallopeptidase [Gaiellaceae bacterium]|nr:M36 family metallopeptidase [Gaiellaceae bacterium]
MSRRPSGLLVALAAAFTALVLVPGSMSASDGGSEPAATAGDAQAVAFSHVRENAAELGVSSADVADLVVTSSYRSAASGITHVNLNQRHRSLEVFGAHATVNVASGGRVVFVGGSLVGGLAADASLEPALGATGAVEAAAGALDLDEPEGLRVLESEGGAAQETVVTGGGISSAPIPARLGWQPTKAGLRLAWQLTIDDSSGDSLWNATVDAETGELLASDDWTDHDDLGDLATTLGRTNLTAQESTVYPVSPSPVLDGSSYRVFRLPDESPNDAPRMLVENPADGLASPFGWHDTDGLPGAEFTITRGNNNHAYLDQDDNEAADFDGSPEGGPALDFDFPVDFSQHSQAYREAVTTNLFYGCNTIHDVLYRYGFDEASGNFQANNYGRGGQEGDYVRCEAADGSGTNNANFSTPSEPTSSGGVGTPRMQMYLWPGNQFGRQNQVVVDGLGEFGATWARFGPPATPAGLSGRTLVYAGLGCVAADYPSPAPASWVAVADGGTGALQCPYLQRAHAAEAAGADALVVVDTDDNPPIMGGSFVAASPGIPSVAVGEDDGEAIKAAIAAGPTTGNVRKHPDHPGIRDGDFDTGIIFHEYGHGVSNRLTGGPAVNCLSGNEQAGEGWSDFLAIGLLLNPELDDPQGTRGLVPYVLFQESRAGNGLRPRPYSRDMSIQPFTYDSIKSNGWLNGTSLALPHGLGHGWAAILWDVTWDLVDKHGFNPNVYEAWDTGGNNRAIQYVMDGLKLQGCGPGLVVSRAAIVAAADELSDGEDTCTVWASFARRGLGYSAVQGTTNRNDNDEAYDTAPECLRGFLPPVNQPYGGLNQWDAGETVPLRFTADGYTGLDVLATNSPFSRKVDCETLRVPSQDPAFVTPRELPIATQMPGNTTLKVNPQGVFHYNWQTLEEWAGTCREVVVTRDDGKQHRAFFSFT